MRAAALCAACLPRPAAAAAANPDPTCARGILYHDGVACCPKECGECGGSGCADRPGGKEDCCSSRVEGNGVSCDDAPAPCSVAPPPQPSPPPAPAGVRNVLYLVADDLRPELHAAYGASHVITPNLDALAARGLTFRNAYCQYSVCAASRNSFMSGLRPDTTGVGVPGGAGSFRDSHPDWVSLPQAFKNSGYLTLGGGKLFHPGKPKDNDEPLSWSQDVAYYKFSYYMKDSRCPSDPTGTPNSSVDVSKQDTWCRVDAADADFYDYGLANHTIGLLRRAKADPRPFFIAAGFARPHAPWRVPARYWDMYNGSSIPLAAVKTAPTGMPDIAYHQQGVYFYPDQSDYVVPYAQKPIPDSVAMTWRHAYYASVTWMDAQVGRVLDELDALGLANNTIVSFHGDHGWQLGEHSLWHKETNFELGARTAYIVAAPHKPASAGQRTSVLAELVDVYPTLLALAGLPASTLPLNGTSVEPAFDDPKGGAALKPVAVTQYKRSCESATSCPQPAEGAKLTYMGYSLRDASWRYTAWMAWPDGAASADWGAAPGWAELYAHGGAGDTGGVDDDVENANVAAAHADVAARLHAQLCAAVNAGACPPPA